MWIRKFQRDKNKGVDSPLPTQAVSNEEFIPRPQSEPQKMVEHLINEMAEVRAPKLGEFWLVPSYTGQDRNEVTAEDAGRLLMLMATFPGSEVESFTWLRRAAGTEEER